MLSEADVFGVMITYNPDVSVVNNIYSLVEQVSRVLIIDNGSDKESLRYFNDIENKSTIDIIYNKDNKGIAHALNQGLFEASLRGYKLILTMDQDSTLLKNCINEMIKVLNNNGKIISVGPNYNNDEFVNNKKYYEVDTLITSGNLTYTDIAKSIGGYTSELFIDSVDFDFSLLLKKNRKKIAIVRDAKMSHRLGENLITKFIWIPVKINVHSPLRHYYMYRNHYYIIKKYIFSFPKFCIKKELIMWKYFLEVIFLHPNKTENISMILKGVNHAIKKKYGEYRC